MSGVASQHLERMKAIASRLWGPGRRWTPGEIAWSALAEGDGQVVHFVGNGFCWLQPDYAVIVVTNEDDARQAVDLVDDRPVQVPAADDALAIAVRAAGRVPLVDAPFDLDLRLHCDDARRPELPEGYKVRSARAGDDLVAAHRDAWVPADLPFADGHRPTFAPDAASDFDGAALARCPS